MESVSLSQHDKRKNQIIDCAAALFFRDGYENTSVQKIIDTVGIAKGTFYHYFNSKIDLLNQFTKRESEKILKALDNIVERKDLNIIDKFNSYFKIAMNWKVENWDLIIIYIKDSGRIDNRIVFETLLESNIKAAQPSLQIMVNEGVEQGYFNTDYPDLVAETIFRFGAVVTEILRPLINNSSSRREGFEHFLRILEFYQNTIEKLLGADKGIFKTFDREQMENIFSKSSSGDEEAFNDQN